MRTAEHVELSSGSEGFLDTFFLVVSRKLSTKPSEHGFLENHGFCAIGDEKNEFPKKTER